jgi:hypothetical protein
MSSIESTMVVHDLDVVGVTCMPAKAYPPTAGRRLEIVQTRGPMQEQQLSARRSLDRAKPWQRLVR